MKKILVMVVAILLFTTVTYAAPFLVCDPPDPSEQVTSYIVYKDGVEFARVDAESDGSLRLDLQGVTPGAYTWTAKAVNIWEESELSDPYISPSGATKPSNTRMEP